MPDPKEVSCRLKPNQEYGKCIRLGKSKKRYEFVIGKATLVSAEDAAWFQDKASPQYEKHLEVVKDV